MSLRRRIRCPRTREQAAVIGRLAEAWRRGDLDGALGVYDPAIELDVSACNAGFFFAGKYHGHAGVKQFFAEWAEDWDDFRSTYERWDHAGDHVVAMVRDRARGKRSGAVTQQLLAHVLTFRAGKVVRYRIFQTREQALAALAGDAPGGVVGRAVAEPQPA